jgi:signal transduction histidine kinase
LLATSGGEGLEIASSHEFELIIGSGLGLSIAKSLTELYGGEIRLRSAPGQGSTFVVSFPCAMVAQSDSAIVAI